MMFPPKFIKELSAELLLDGKEIEKAYRTKDKDRDTYERLIHAFNQKIDEQGYQSGQKFVVER